MLVSPGNSVSSEPVSLSDVLGPCRRAQSPWEETPREGWGKRGQPYIISRAAGSGLKGTWPPFHSGEMPLGGAGARASCKTAGLSLKTWPRGHDGHSLPPSPLCVQAEVESGPLFLASDPKPAPLPLCPSFLVHRKRVRSPSPYPLAGTGNGAAGAWNGLAAPGQVRVTT